MEIRKKTEQGVTTVDHYHNSIVQLKAVIRQDNTPDPALALIVSRETSALSVSYALDSPNKIRELLKTDPNGVFDVLNNLIMITNMSLNVAHKLNAFQVLPIIEMIKTDFKNLTIEEIRICFRDGVKGKYGPTMHRFDVEVCAGWLNGYCDNERWSEIEKRNAKRSEIVSYEEGLNLLKQKVENIQNIEKGGKPKDGFVNPNARKYFAELKESIQKNKIGNNLPPVLRSLDDMKVKWKEDLSKMADEDILEARKQNEIIKSSYWQELEKCILQEITNRIKNKKWTIK